MVGSSAIILTIESGNSDQISNERLCLSNGKFLKLKCPLNTLVSLILDWTVPSLNISIQSCKPVSKFGFSFKLKNSITGSNIFLFSPIIEFGE